MIDSEVNECYTIHYNTLTVLSCSERRASDSLLSLVSFGGAPDKTNCQDSYCIAFPQKTARSDGYRDSQRMWSKIEPLMSKTPPTRKDLPNANGPSATNT